MPCDTGTLWNPTAYPLRALAMPGCHNPCPALDRYTVTHVFARPGRHLCVPSVTNGQGRNTKENRPVGVAGESGNFCHVVRQFPTGEQNKRAEPEGRPVAPDLSLGLKLSQFNHYVVPHVEPGLGNQFKEPVVDRRIAGRVRRRIRPLVP